MFWDIISGKDFPVYSLQQYYSPSVPLICIGIAATTFFIVWIVQSRILLVTKSRGVVEDIEMADNSTGLLEETDDKSKGLLERLDELPKLENTEELTSFIKNLHSTPNYAQQLEFVLLGLQYKTNEEVKKEEIRRICLLIYSAEWTFHSSKSEAHNWLKQNLSSDAVKILLSNVNIGFLGQMTDVAYFDVYGYITENFNALLKKTKDICCKTKSQTNQSDKKSEILSKIKKITKMIVLYMDLTKDTVLWIKLVSLLSISTILKTENLSMFQIQFVYILITSICLPLFLSSCIIALTNPLAPFGYQISSKQAELSKKQIHFFRFLTIVFFPVIPGMLLFAAEDSEDILGINSMDLLELIQKKEATKKNLGKVKEIKKIKELAKKSLLQIKQYEVLETNSQLVLQTIMILMYHSETTTTGGFETVFGIDKNENYFFWVSTTVFLVFSILFSLNKSTRNIVSSKKASFGAMLSGLSMIMVGLRSFLITVVRTSCAVAFFTPYLGLFDILKHLQSEQIILDVKSKFEVFGGNDYHVKPENVNFEKDNFSYWNTMNSSIETIPYVNLYTTNYNSTDPSLPTYDKYTLGTLETGYFCFIGLLCVNIFAILISKIGINPKFRQLTKFQMMQETLSSFALPDSHRDWSQDHGTAAEYLVQRKKCLKETVLMSLLQCLFHLVMLLPLWYTGINSDIRISKHQVLQLLFFQHSKFLSATIC